MSGTEVPHTPFPYETVKFSEFAEDICEYELRKPVVITYKKCPKCGSNNSVDIVYGMPSYELFQEAKAGKVKLGGCMLEAGNPEYFCKDCEHEWNKE